MKSFRSRALLQGASPWIVWRPTHARLRDKDFGARPPAETAKIA